jgi:hypothetical protein
MMAHKTSLCYFGYHFNSVETIVDQPMALVNDCAYKVQFSVYMFNPHE